MARPAPAASRALAIIDFLASHSSEKFTLSDLARRTGTNGASAHAVAAVLQERGYVIRHPTQKVYSLGPAIIAAGMAALEQQSVIRYAIDEVTRLSEALKLEIFGTAVAGDDIICFARAGRPGPTRESMYVGHRVPFVPPLGSLFVAWADEDEERRWLERLGPLTAETLQLLQKELARVRSRGYSLGLAVGWHTEFNQAVMALADEPASPARRQVLERVFRELGRDDYQLAELDANRRYVLRSIAVPVFDSNAKVVAVLSTTAGEELTADEILRALNTLQDSATVISRQVNARFPELAPE
jgi:DNA-binding IclR family transcriptional regulator